MSRPLSVIAADIRKDWKKPYYAAVPYLEALGELDGINDNFLSDSGRSIVLYFLGNSGTWRGETAKKIKTELRAMLSNKSGTVTKTTTGDSPSSGAVRR